MCIANAFTFPLFLHWFCIEFALNWHWFFIDVVLNLQRGFLGRVGISKHGRGNSKLLAYNQKPQPQLGPNVQALRRGLRQNLQPWGWAGPPGRPRPKVAISVEVHASVLGHIVPALAVASDWMPAILNFLACAWKFRLAPKIPLCKFNTTSKQKRCQFNANSVQIRCKNNGKVKAIAMHTQCNFNTDQMQL